MIRSAVAIAIVLAVSGWRLPAAHGYVEVPMTLGKVVEDSTHIALLEVTRVNREKGLILYKKLKDLKGQLGDDPQKHNIGAGERGFHPRETKNVMAWAEVGARALFFCNDEASETCIGTYWYQCYREEQWWGMSHAEPYLLRTFCGDVDVLAVAVSEILAGKEVIVSCLVDGQRERLHERKGKLQRLRASRERLEYDAPRDFVGFGADGVDMLETKTETLLAASTTGWKFLPESQLQDGESWVRAEFDDRAWPVGKSPIGYGEDEIANRGGTTIEHPGEPFVFRRAFNVPAALLSNKQVTYELCIAADNCAHVYLNGEGVLDEGEEDHEFSYWNQYVEIAASQLKPGRNVLAVYVPNGAESSDLFFDLQLSAEVPLPKKPVPKSTPKLAAKSKTDKAAAKPTAAAVPAVKLTPGAEVKIDKAARTVSLPCRIAARKLPNLSEVYPLEVIATAPPPRGRKAHETVITTDARPSDVHAALVALGLQPGAPAQGEGAQATGPEVMLVLQFAIAGKQKSLPIEQALVNTKTSKTLVPLKWFFTGSIQKQPDPERDESVYAADLSGTLIAIFPVTNETVLQSNLTLADEPTLKLETNKRLLPPEGTEVTLLIKAN